MVVLMEEKAKKLLVVGLEQVLLGNTADLSFFNQQLNTIRDQAFLVYTTDYSLGSVLALEQMLRSRPEGLLTPDYLICEGGIGLYQREGTEYLPLVQWMNELNQNWSREGILKITQQFSSDVLALQPEEPGDTTTAGGPFRLRFSLDPGQEWVVQQLEDLFLQHEIKAQVVSSQDWCLDVMAADKAEAVDYLRAQLGISEEDSYFFGDHPSDLSLLKLPCRGTILGNARTELTANLESVSQLYRSPYPSTQGIVDGLHHWGLLNNFAFHNSKAG
jgi:hydroxymethylpyrimidine pyrophosphatase-like HAD family hydrolase